MASRSPRMRSGARIIEANRNAHLRDGEIVCEESPLEFFGLAERCFNSSRVTRARLRQQFSRRGGNVSDSETRGHSIRLRLQGPMCWKRKGAMKIKKRG